MLASDRVYGALRDDIQSGLLEPDAVLNEVAESTRFGVSRTPVREALSKLAAEGLVRRSHQGVRVASRFGPSEIISLFEARLALERAAASIAARPGDAATFQSLEAQLAAAAHTEDASSVVHDLLAGHLVAAIDDAVKNHRLTAELQRLRTHHARLRAGQKELVARRRMLSDEHRLIASAIADRDADLAAHATHVHLHNALRSILDSIGATDHHEQGAA
ncbi:GntR family transcriptional regulator [Microbacterium sp. F51-2R]|uniref:GntR family transcriptional regulator n=1 Tax=Microbacterium sp. F51-2R TaxID=3445777 RepID=UPI003FA04294